MTESPYGERFARIGEKILSNVANKRSRYFLYTEVEPNVVDISIYEVLESELLWLDDEDDPDGDDEVTYLILDAWNAEPEGKRWVAMEYSIDDGRFAVQLHYPGEIDFEDDDRREKLLAKRYPGKSVRYPPLRDDNEEWLKLNPT